MIALILNFLALALNAVTLYALITVSNRIFLRCWYREISIRQRIHVDDLLRRIDETEDAVEWRNLAQEIVALLDAIEKRVTP